MHQSSALYALLSIFLISVAAQKKDVLIWMCLDRCDGFDLQRDLTELQNHLDVVTIVSFENWQVSQNGTLEWATASGVNVTDVYASVKAMGVEAVPMITSAKIKDLRILFANPDPFLDQVVAVAVEKGYTGFNIDFEPEQKSVDEHDAYMFEQFIGKFAKRLHQHGVKFSVDVASWSVFWNFSLLAQQGVDRILTMDTYTTDMSWFDAHVNFTIEAVGRLNTGIGLDSNAGNYSSDIYAHMLNTLQTWNVREVDVWHDETPISDDFWAFLKKFTQS